MRIEPHVAALADHVVEIAELAEERSRSARVGGRPIRADKRDENQLVLEWDGRRWLFLSGM